MRTHFFTQICMVASGISMGGEKANNGGKRFDTINQRQGGGIKSDEVGTSVDHLISSNIKELHFASVYSDGIVEIYVL